MSNIGFSKIHSYTVEKVKWAMEFVNKTNRFTSVQEWLDAYNYLKGTNKKLEGCRSCAVTRYVQGVKNYALLGYQVLLAEGHSADEFVDQAEAVEEEPAPIENEEERVVLTKEEPKEEDTEKPSEPTEDEPTEEEPVEEEQPIEEKELEEEPKTIKKKGGRPKKSTSKK